MLGQWLLVQVLMGTHMSLWLFLGKVFRDTELLGVKHVCLDARCTLGVHCLHPVLPVYVEYCTGGYKGMLHWKDLQGD